MGYSLIVLIASTTLVAYFVVISDASLIWKTVVGGFFMFAFACFYWIRGWSLVGLVLLVLVGLFVILYRAWDQGQWPGK
jgi:hypothetical protein